MSFVEIQFPPDISYGSVGGPVYSTDIVETFGGWEQRNINWADARGRWNVAHGVKTRTQLAELIAFFRARRGRAIAFRFKDWSDYSANSQLIGTGTGAQTVFPLVKTYHSAITITRRISKPVAGSVTVYVDGVEQSSGIVVNSITGVVTLAVAPDAEAVITADFQFDVPVRFDIDNLDITLDAPDIGGWMNIPVVEVRV